MYFVTAAIKCSIQYRGSINSHEATYLHITVYNTDGDMRHDQKHLEVLCNSWSLSCHLQLAQKQMVFFYRSLSFSKCASTSYILYIHLSCFNSNKVSGSYMDTFRSAPTSCKI